MYLSVTVMLLSRLRKRKLLSWKLYHSLRLSLCQ